MSKETVRVVVSNKLQKMCSTFETDITPGLSVGEFLDDIQRENLISPLFASTARVEGCKSRKQKVCEAGKKGCINVSVADLADKQLLETLRDLLLTVPQDEPVTVENLKTLFAHKYSVSLSYAISLLSQEIGADHTDSVDSYIAFHESTMETFGSIDPPPGLGIQPASKYIALLHNPIHLAPLDINHEITRILKESDTSGLKAPRRVNISDLGEQLAAQFHKSDVRSLLPNHKSFRAYLLTPPQQKLFAVFGSGAKACVMLRSEYKKISRKAVQERQVWCRKTGEKGEQREGPGSPDTVDTAPVSPVPFLTCPPPIPAIVPVEGFGLWIGDFEGPFASLLENDGEIEREECPKVHATTVSVLSVHSGVECPYEKLSGLLWSPSAHSLRFQMLRELGVYIRYLGNSSGKDGVSPVVKCVLGGSIGRGTEVEGCAEALDGEIVLVLRDAAERPVQGLSLLTWVPDFLLRLLSVIQQSKEAPEMDILDPVYLPMALTGDPLDGPAIKFMCRRSGESECIEVFVRVIPHSLVANGLSHLATAMKNMEADAIAPQALPLVRCAASGLRVAFMTQKCKGFGEVQATARMLKWWRAQQVVSVSDGERRNLSGSIYSPNDRLLECVAAYIWFATSPSSLKQAVANCMGVLSRLDEVCIVWPNFYPGLTGSGERQTVWCSSTSRPLLLDPVSPFENLISPTVYDFRVLKKLAKTTKFFW